jgi:outer membrane protein TolC
MAARIRLTAPLLLLGWSFPAQAQEAVPLTLREAIVLALEANPDLITARAERRQAEARVDVEQGIFAPRLVSRLELRYRDLPIDALSLPLIDRALEGRLALEGKLATGLSYSLGWDLAWRELSGSSALYSPLYTTGLRIEVEQPLWRGAWPRAVLAPIRVAQLRQEESQHLFTARVNQLSSQVEVAYWDLLLALTEVEEQKRSLALAKQQVAESQAQLRAGAVAMIDVLEAQAAVARTEDEIESAQTAAIEAEARLMNLVRPPAEESRLGADGPYFQPVDKPDPQQEPGRLEDRVRTALDQRPDLRAAESRRDAAEVQRLVAETLLGPAFSLVGGAGLRGASGRLLPSYASAGFNTPLVHGLTGDLLPPLLPAASDEGDLARAFENLERPEAWVGLKLEIPLDNIAARARLQIEEAELRRQSELLGSLKRQVKQEVASAFERLESDLARIKTGEHAVELAEKLLDGQKKRFKSGVGVSFDVLRASEGVTSARIALIRARVRAQISAARLALAEGTYLEARGITVDR